MWITDNTIKKFENVKTKASDLLDSNKISDLPHPLCVMQYDGSIYELESICVETGLCRFLVCGLVDCCPFGYFKFLVDADGIEHETDIFYVEIV